MEAECLTCKSLCGERRISPGPVIHEGEYWLVEHAYPANMKGWVVIVLKRHAEALHELRPEEFRELAEMQNKAAKALFLALGCRKEYVLCLAEKEGFYHIHVHVVARRHDLPDALKGTKIFAAINVPSEEALPRDEIRAFCEELRSVFERVN